jgi:hypothetical protein
MVLAAAVAAFWYSRPNPEYGWLHFGPEAKLRVLIRLDGQSATLEYYSGSKPTGRKDYFEDRSKFEGLTLADPDGKTSYVITSLGAPLGLVDGPAELTVSVDIKGPLEYKQYCDLLFGPYREQAPVAHFHGPLTAQPQTINWELPPRLSLRRGDRPTDLRSVIGTLDATRRCWVVVRSHDVLMPLQLMGASTVGLLGSTSGQGPILAASALTPGRENQDQPCFSTGVHPFADVEFPPQKQGDPPITRRYPLDHVC